jgi:hypothetical protein
MPAHRTYIEAFLGTGVILRTKLPAAKNIGIEKDPKVLADFKRQRPKLDLTFRPATKPELTLLEGDALELLPRIPWESNTLVYADPPYLGSVRNQPFRAYYDQELMSEEEHERLLSFLTALPVMVMISGYQSELYCRRLATWRNSQKWTVTRGGTRVQEWLWMNFPEPVFFHDTRFAGADFTGRQGLKRKVTRWVRKFSARSGGQSWRPSQLKWSKNRD